MLSPDRLARKYAYQVLLLEEFRRAGCAVAFLHHPISDDPNDQLLLQIQGAIAEYERAVLGERFRRGKLQKARAGQVIGGRAPYGYRYVPRQDGCPGPSGHRRGRGRAGADALRLADRGADDHPPDPQAAELRALAPALRPASLVAIDRAPHPVRPGLHRHRLRQPLRRTCRPAEAALGAQPGGGEHDLPPAAAPGAMDRHPGPGDHRPGAMGSRPGPAGAQRRPLVPQQHQVQLPAALPADLRSCGLAMYGITMRATGKHRSGATTSATARIASPAPDPPRVPSGPVKCEDLENAVWEHVVGLLSDPVQLAAQFEQSAARAEAGTAQDQAAERQVQGAPEAVGSGRSASGRCLSGRRSRAWMNWPSAAGI